MCGRYDNLTAREAYRLISARSACRRRTIRRATTLPRLIRFPSCASTRTTGSASSSRRVGTHPGLDEREAQSAAHQRARRDGAQAAALSRGVRPTPLPPATGFFEWQKVADGKQPWRFARKDLAVCVRRHLGIRAAQRRGDSSSRFICDLT